MGAVDKNKFLVYTSEGELQEFTFFEKSFNVLDMSCKGEICLSMQNTQVTNADAGGDSRKKP